VRDELAPEAIVKVHADLSPARALRHAAAAEDAELLVVGSRHRRRLQHIVEGDHAMQVLHGAACAVAIAPDPLAPHPELQRIGVGIDATPESERALAMARDLAERTGARLWLRAVVDDTISSWAGLSPMGGPPDVYEKIIASRVSAAHELLAERLEDCRGLSAEGTVVVGSPTGELVLASEGLDLLVLGSRRWGPVRRPSSSASTVAKPAPTCSPSPSCWRRCASATCPPPTPRLPEPCTRWPSATMRI
jgi:nucleotide-binding universal stress UspA family protein